MKIYVAADFVRAEDASSAAARCGQKGLEVVSTWHDEALPAEVEAASTVGGPPPNEARVAAKRNIGQIESADVVVMLCTGSRARGGRHFETGYAHALGKPIVLIGPKEHAFHELDGMRHADNVEALISILRDLNDDE